MNFHRYLVGSHTVILANDSKEDVLHISTYKLKLREENMFLSHDTLCALRVQYSLC